MTQAQIAAKIALEAHKDQEYGPGVPYSYHLHQVADLVVKMYEGRVSESVLDKLVALAYLHDVLEDTDVQQSYLAQQGICDKVIHGAVAISKLGESYDEYISKVVVNKLALRVKLCDTSCNLENSIREGNMKRINNYTKQIQLLGGFK